MKGGRKKKKKKEKKKSRRAPFPNSWEVRRQVRKKKISIPPMLGG